MNTAIIVAAGRGKRFCSEVPKQFVEIAGKPLIIHTLEKFENCSAIDAIILVLSGDEIEQFQISSFRSVISKLGLIVAGGASRAESVRNGLDKIDTFPDVVVVHDGARPLVTVDEIEACVAKAAETGAACLVATVTDTIKTVNGGEIVSTLDRDKLRRALTPQAFKYDILRKAFENVELDETSTDECYLVEKLGHRIACVEGSGRNIKVTTQDDKLIAEMMLKNEI